MLAGFTVVRVNEFAFWLNGHDPKNNHFPLWTPGRMLSTCDPKAPQSPCQNQGPCRSDAKAAARQGTSLVNMQASSYQP